MSGPRRKAVLYARVSSDAQEREGYSIPAQIRILTEYAFRNGLEVIRKFVEVESAAKQGRTVFEEMVQYLGDTNEVTVALFEKADRATRNLPDFVALDELKQRGIELHFVREGVILSANSDPSVQLMWGMQTLWARSYSQNLSHETKKGQAEKIKQGGWPHLAPIGYLNVKDERGRSIIVLDPDRAPLLRKLFRRYDSEPISLGDLLEAAKDIGLRSRSGKGLSKSQLSVLLRHPLMAGYIPRGEWRVSEGSRDRPVELVPGSHEPLVDEALWRRVQEKLEGRTQRTRRSKTAGIYAGLLTCGHCGARMTASNNKGRRGRVYTYYMCWRAMGDKSCPGQRLREKVVTEQLAERFGVLEFEADLVELLREALLVAEEAEQQHQVEARLSLRRQRSKIEAQTETAYDDRLEGRLPLKQFDRVNLRLQEELRQVEQRLVGLQRADARFREEAFRLLEWCARASEAFLAADPVGRRSLIETVLQTPRIEGDRLVAEWAQLFEPIALAVQSDREVVLVGNARCEKWLQSSDLKP